MNPALAHLRVAAEALSLGISPAALERFDRYLEEMLAWRRRLNLTATTGATEIVLRHFVDSLLPLTVVEFPPSCAVVDVGSGAGFPAVPMKIVRPDLKVTLTESSQRRVAFLEHLRRALALADVEIVWGRVEQLGRGPALRESFWMATERAAARLARALELSLPLVKVGGAAVLVKGRAVLDELRPVSPLIHALGGLVERAEPCVVQGTERQSVVLVARKIKPTPEIYPRSGRRLGALS